jgi:hypothetical protein
MSEENVDVVRWSWQTVSSDGELPFEWYDADLRIENMPEFPIPRAV